MPGHCPKRLGFTSVAWWIDTMTGVKAEQSLQTLDCRMSAIEGAYGLGLDPWPRGSAPEEYEQLSRWYDQAWDDLYAENLEAFGEREIACLFRTDQRRFELLLEAGRQYFHGPGVCALVWQELSIGS